MGKSVYIIGGGASGMMAAIHAAKEGAQVTILEHTDRVGRKLLSTGNGRCNLTNLYQAPECYRSCNPGFPMEVTAGYPVRETLRFFEGLGILPKSKDGYIYPNSEQASAVLDALRMEIDHQTIKVLCGCEVKEIRRGKNRDSDASGHRGSFDIKTSLGTFRGDSLILAAGSKAAPVTGSDGSGYELAQKLGHTVIPPLPALVQLRCQEKHYKQLAGIRTEARLKLLINGAEADTQEGELQLTDYGISGIPTFQLSRYASIALASHRRVQVLIDYLPRQTVEETDKFLKERAKTMGDRTALGFMTGLLNKKLALVLLKLSNIPDGEVVSRIDGNQWKKLLKQIKEYETTVTAANPFENAQVCCGGVDTREVNPRTMESKVVPGLYIAGELLDVDGICGGYNLQWAWSSGALAGIHAGGGQK